MTANKIEIKDVYKSFGAKKVLNGVTLAVPTGTSLVVIGGSAPANPSPSSASSACSRPDKGRILVDGQDITNASAARAAKRSTPASACCSRARRFSTVCASGKTSPSSSSVHRGCLSVTPRRSP